MQNEMKSYVESMKDSMLMPKSNNPYQQNYGNQVYDSLQLPIPQDNLQQIAMIGNVFYNMLNMLGD